MHSRVYTVLAAALVAGCTRSGDSSDADNVQSSSEARDTSASSQTEPAAAPPVSLPEYIRPDDPPRHPASAVQVGEAIERLSNHVRAGATDPLNPWAMAHGLIAFGRDLKTTNGASVTELIVRDYLKVAKLDGRTVHGFPPRTSGNEPLEPHPSMIAKSFAEVGVPREQPFAFKGGETTLGKLMDDAMWTFNRPRSGRDWHNFGWLASVIAIHPPPDGRIQTHNGPVAVQELATEALTQLEREQAFLVPFKKRGRPDLVVKQKQGIYAHTCGGLHFVQGTVRLAGPYPELRTRIKTQLDLVRFRWAAERRLYRRLADLKPNYRPLLLVQELKFYGHLIETMALAVKWDLIDADPALKEEMKLVAGDLLDTLAALEPLYARLDSIRDVTPQFYYDLIGDGCHAIRGMREGLVAFY